MDRDATASRAPKEHEQMSERFSEHYVLSAFVRMGYIHPMLSVYTCAVSHDFHMRLSTS